MIVQNQIVALLVVLISTETLSKPALTFDEFFNYTDYLSITLAPDDEQSILVQSNQRIWDRKVNEIHLHLYSLQNKTKTLITTQASDFKPQWKGEWIALILNEKSTDKMQYIHLYSVRTGQMVPLIIGEEKIHDFTWSTTNMSLYIATRTPWTKAAEETYENNWKDVIQYREQYRGDTIYRVDIENMTVSKIEPLANITSSVSEIICSPNGNQLVFSVKPPILNQERMTDYELYSLDMTHPLPIVPSKLTNNTAQEENFQWSVNDLLFFTVSGAGSIEGDYEDSQGRLYSINMTSKKTQRWAEQFQGHITSYALLQGGREGVILLGQLSTEIQIYTQLSLNEPLIKRTGWNGTYEKILTTSDSSHSSTIAFIHSSFESPQEVYFTDHIDRLNEAQAVTYENQWFIERNLPKGKSYQWFNENDRTEIEGVLIYPPDKFEHKNLPLLVLIHGGPYDAALNDFHADWYYCGNMFATEGWLVFQPNYRGSTGYGDEFMRGVRFQILSRPGNDILYGVDALVRDGVADPKRLTVGGYSYGGYLTGWLITQTTRFNAALFGAAAIEHVVDWALTDIPYASIYSFGGYPWQVSHLYQQEAAIFQLDKVRTPTHIVVPGNDIRVSSTGNYVLERGLHALGVPTKLIALPDEPHSIGNNPWHGKIKLREEILWLQKYGNISVSTSIC